MSTHHERGGTATRDLHRKAIAKSKPDCHLCGTPIDYNLVWLAGAHSPRCARTNCIGCVPHPMRFELDHVVPLSKGGPDSLENKAASHRSCNRAKSDRFDAERPPPLATTRTW